MMEPSEFVLHVDKLTTITSLQLHMVLQSFANDHGFCDAFTVSISEYAKRYDPTLSLAYINIQ